VIVSREKPSGKDESINPLLSVIKEYAEMGSVRELVLNAMRRVSQDDLPEDPDELKEVLIGAVDFAVSVKKAQKEH